MSLFNIYRKAPNTNRIGIKPLGPIELFNTLIIIYKYASFKISKPISS